MKILWITNDLLPEAKSILSKQSCQGAYRVRKN